MTTQTQSTSVQTSVIVDAPIERAFDVFTTGMAKWWPPSHHILQGELATMVFEPRVGGHIYDKGVDGSECRWARVLAFDPPDRVVFSWNITPSFQLETDDAKASEVEVRFRAESPTRTVVDVEHRHLDRHGDGWEYMRTAVSSSGGWKAVLQELVTHLRD